MSIDTISITLSERIGETGGLISILQEIQAKYSYLPEEVLREVSKETGRSLVDIYGVATFYKAFSLKPRGQHLVSVCLGTACHVRGGPAVAQALIKELGVGAGETTEDNMFTLETVNCLGACAIGPVIVIDGHYFPKVKPAMVRDILDKARTGLDHVQVDTDSRVFPIDVSCTHCNHTLADQECIIDGHPAIRVTISFGNNHGWMAMSSLWGSYEISSSHQIPDETIVNMFCPYCHGELLGGAKCGDCGAPMVPMIVRNGGVVQICSRRGCRGHILDLGGTSIA